MITMKIQISNIFFLGLMIINLNCSRNDPEVVNNNPDVQSIKPVFIYDLNISEPSGITYNSKNNSLMVVSDGKPDIYEIDFMGNILATIPTTSSDMEGITLSKNCDTIFVVEETNKLVSSYLISGSRLSSFSFNVATDPKHALEGIAKNNVNGHTFFINEKLPCMILEFNNTTELWRREINYSIDISDIYYDEANNLLWIVSDESKKILKLSSEWRLNF